MDTQCPPSSSSSSTHPWDVFLSFRGADTRRGFIGHLYDDLVLYGIKTFKDDKELGIGDSLYPELMKAIEESKCAIIVFSKNYAASTWCLKELVKILEFKKDMRRKLLVLPVFYDVDPSVLRHQRSPFKEAFESHEKRFSENMEMVKKWRTALTEVSNFIGEDLTIQYRHETDAIKNIRRKISEELLDKCPSVTKGLVGIDSQVEKLNLDLKSNDVRLIGIWGMGGIGKTALAKAVFDTFSHKFGGCSFIENVKESCLTKVQQQLLSDMKVEDRRIVSARAGVDRIKFSLRLKKILLVLDDVKNRRQLKNLVEWEHFGSGSRIIITTRDQNLFNTLKVHHDNIYECKRLSHSDALKLFCLNAFEKEQPEEGYDELSTEIVNYASGLPLALVSLGSSLASRAMNEWKDKLMRLKKDLEDDIFKILKISYDELNNEDERKIFIYIACFLKGRKEDLVKDILYNLDASPTLGMSVLKERSLITISDNIVLVHNLLEQMGWEILRKKSLDERTGIKFRENIVDALKNNMETKAVEIINQEIPMEEVANCKPKAFSNMRKLRFLNIRDVHFPDGVEYLSNELRILKWNGYPSNSLPSSFTPNKIYELHMCSSKIEKLWERATQEFRNLRFINLSGSKYLTETPNLSGTPNLERLNLSDCENLVEVDSSIFVHKGLNYLNLTRCISFETFPKKIEMDSLKIFTLSHCSKVKQIPEFGENMKSLQKLDLDGTAVKTLPSSLKACICCWESCEVVNFSKCSKRKKLQENYEEIVCRENIDLSTVTSTQKFVEAAASDELATNDLANEAAEDLTEERRSKRSRQAEVDRKSQLEIS